jgi:phospholipase/lecithinase/hemolysin
MAITSLFVTGNSFSATTQQIAYGRWPGLLSAGLGFAFVQAYNKAQPSAQLLTITSPPRPGLIAQLQSMPAGSKVGALLTVWIFPALNKPLKAVEFYPVYQSGLDRAYTLGFRMVLMPNLPDITKTPLYKRTYSRKQLNVWHNSFAFFNSQYNTMIGNFRNRYPGSKFATVDMFTRWNGQGVVADGFHPNAQTHRMFAQWFYNAIVSF